MTVVFLEDLADKGIGKVSIETQILPTIVIDPVQQTGDKSWLMQIVKPRIRNDGAVKLDIAPEGVPTRNYFPLVVVVGVVISALAVFGAYSLLKS